jgi:hypothetical protein
VGLTTSNIRRATENQRHHHCHQTATRPAARRSESLNRIVTVSSVVQSVLSRPTLLMDAGAQAHSRRLEAWFPRAQNLGFLPRVPFWREHVACTAAQVPTPGITTFADSIFFILP